MDRILVLGSGGSGKSTLSKELGRIFNLPVIHLDKYFWNPNWNPTPDEEWEQVVQDFAQQDRWVIDGNYSRTLDIRLKRADLIIYLDMPRLLCIYRIIKRRIMYHKKTRPDMNEECPEKLDWEFFRWVWNYRKRSRMRTINKLNEISGQKQIRVVNTRKQVRVLIKEFEKNTRAPGILD